MTEATASANMTAQAAKADDATKEAAVPADGAVEAERAVLGALLARPALLRLVLRFLRADDFRDPRNRAVFDAMHEAYRAAPSTTNERSRGPRTDRQQQNHPSGRTPGPEPERTSAAPVTTMSRRNRSVPEGAGAAAPTSEVSPPSTSAADDPDNHPQTYAELLRDALTARGVDESFVRGLAESCPDPDRAAVYGRMVMINRVRTHMGDLGRQLAASAQAAVNGDGRLAVPLGHLDQLVAAVSDLDSRWGRRHPTSEDASHETAAGRRRLREVDARVAAREDSLLADLMRHPTQVAVVAEWLRPEDFQAPGRGRAYAAVRALTQRGDPIDPVTLTTEARQRGALAASQGEDGDAKPRHTRALTADELLALGDADIAVGTAIEAGREVLRAATLATVAHHAQAIADLQTANLSADDVFNRTEQSLSAMQKERARLVAAGLDPTSTRATRQTPSRRWRTRADAPTTRQVATPKVIPSVAPDVKGVRPTVS